MKKVLASTFVSDKMPPAFSGNPPPLDISHTKMQMRICCCWCTCSTDERIKLVLLPPGSLVLNACVLNPGWDPDAKSTLAQTSASPTLLLAGAFDANLIH